MTQAEALPILTRYTAGLTNDERTALLTETAVKRTVNESETLLYDPYAAALAHLMHPDTLKAKTEGEVSETYADLGSVTRYLERKSADLQAAFPLPEDARTLKPDLTLTFFGY